MDTLTPEDRRRTMAAVKGTDTTPELIVRRLLHGAGYRFRLHRKDLPGKPDIVLPKHRAAIFVHGCFWHQHLNCKHAARPASRRSYWDPKLDRNVARDARNLAALEEAGWRTLVIWECEMSDKEALARRLAAFLEGGG